MLAYIIAYFSEIIYLVTSITHCVVTSVASWSKECLSKRVKVGILNSWLESMLGVVTVLHAYVARDAQVVVWTGCAGHKVLLGKLRNARVACACSKWLLEEFH
jgi:hypothetical protein